MRKYFEKEWEIKGLKLYSGKKICFALKVPSFLLLAPQSYCYGDFKISWTKLCNNEQNRTVNQQRIHCFFSSEQMGLC